MGGALTGALTDLLFLALTIVQWLIIITALISWVSPDPRNPIVRFLYRATEPILRPFRRILPPSRTGGIDFSPLLVILLIFFIKRVLARLLYAPASLMTF
jgi:YggT family protein